MKTVATHILRPQPPRKGTNGEANKLALADEAAHAWYRFVLSYPPHLVRDYLYRLNVDEGQTVLDPFCGTGTTVVECKKLGITSMGVEAHPMPHFAGQVKTDWTLNPDELVWHAALIAEAARRGANLVRRGSTTTLTVRIEQLGADCSPSLLRVCAYC